MSTVLGYNVNQDVRPTNLVGALQGGLQAGNQFSEGLLKNYQMRQQLGVTGALNDLKQQYMQAPDDQTRAGLLNKMMVLDPTSAKTMAEGQQLIGAPLPGTSDLAMLANANYKQLIAAGYPADQAKSMAINNSLASNGVVNALGQFQPKPPLPPVVPYGQLGGQAPQSSPQVAPQGGLGAPINTAVTSTPLPPIGDQLGGAPSGAESAANVLNAYKTATPDEVKLANDFTSASPAQQQKIYQDWYAKNSDTHPEAPATLTPQVATHLQGLANYNQENIPDGGIVSPTTSPAITLPNRATAPVNPINTNVDMGTLDTNNPINQRIVSPAGQLEAVKSDVSDAKTYEKSILDKSTTAQDTMQTYRQIDNVLDSGWKGGLMATPEYMALKAKAALPASVGGGLTPEQQSFVNNYDTLNKLSLMQVGQHVKDMFQRVTNFELGFAKSLQPEPGDLASTARVNNAINEARALQDIKTGELLNQWKQHFNSTANVNNKGQNFQAYANEYFEKNPVLTPAYFASKGIAVPISSFGDNNTKFGKMSPQEVYNSLPVGSTFIDPISKQTRIKRANHVEKASGS